MATHRRSFSHFNPSILVSLALFLLFSACRPTPELPVLQTLPGFSLTERGGSTVTLDSLKGQVWVAHFMFSRCEGPCPRMIAEMKHFKGVIGPVDGLKWVSISADPSYDRPDVLKTYAKRFTDDEKNWLFVTGEGNNIYTLAEKGFLLPVNPGSAETGSLITHSLRLVVVDQEGRIRAYLKHFEDDTEDKLKATLKALL